PNISRPSMNPTGTATARTATVRRDAGSRMFIGDSLPLCRRPAAAPVGHARPLVYQSARLCQRRIYRLPSASELPGNRRHGRPCTRHLDGQLLLGWGELRLAPTGPPAYPCCSQSRQHPVANQIPFELGKGGENPEEQLTLTGLR